MDLIQNLWFGFAVAVTPINLGLCLIGALVGTLIGVLPGIGPLATIAMLLPITFGLPPVGALIMLAGIYYGAQYGGSTTSILINIPGESSSVVTTLDGFQMARQGRAGPALAIAAIGSFFAGCVSTVLVAALGVPLTSIALLFGRGTVLGSILGILPGGGAVIAAFAAYTFEKKMSKTPERFGRGIIQGVAAPESANNAAAQTSFIPLLTLGIPPNAVMALMVGAMTIHGIVPGPQVMTKQPGLFWGMIASMWVGNLMLVVINLPLVGVWVTLLRVPYRLLYPSIIVFCCIGIYSINNSPTDVVIAAIFGIVGYWLVKHDFEPAPMLLGFVLGPLMEENLRRAMLIARGDATVVFTRPISGVLLSTAIILLIIAALPKIRRRRDEVFVE